MNFLNPLFLFGLAAAALPILIHLFTRRRPRDVRFSSLEFLSEVNQSEIRRLRLKQWLLLALRTLAIAALAMAFARPAQKGDADKGGGRAASSVVALVDVSGSMGAPSADGRPLAVEARRVVEDLLSTLGPADELWLVPYDQVARPTSERPLADVPRLRAAAQAIVAGAHVTNHAAGLEVAARALEGSHALNRELFWISDFQQAGFAQGAFAPPKGPWREARTTLIPLTPRARANAALTDAALAPSGSADSSAAALAVTAEGFGITPGDVPVEARALGGTGDPSLGRGFLSLPGRGEGRTLLPLARSPEAGGEVLLPDDALPLDNRRVFASGRSGTLRILVREDGGPSPMRLALGAGSPASGLDVRAPGPGTFASEAPQADVLVIGDVARLAPNEQQAVLDFWRGGGGVLLAPGARADLAFWNGFLAELGAGSMGPLENAASGAAWRLMRVAAGHAVLAGFPARPGEALSTARFQTVRSWRVPPAGDTRVLLEYDRTRPALIERPHALVMNALDDPASSDFALSGAFLPLLHQAVKVLGRGTAAASLAPGDVYRAPGTTGDWRIEDEDGRQVPAALAAEHGATRLVSAPLERPGLYRVFEGTALRTTFAVNPDPRESDLASADPARLAAAFPAGRARVMPPGADLARRVREARNGRELWPWFLALALGLLVAESVIGRVGMGGGAAKRP